MKKSEAYVLYKVLGKAESKSLGRKDVIEYIKLKIALKKEYDLIKEFREELLGVIKEKGENEASLKEFEESFSNYLDEDTHTEIDAEIFTVDKLADFIRNNNFNADEESHLISVVLKK